MRTGQRVGRYAGQRAQEEGRSEKQLSKIEKDISGDRARGQVSIRLLIVTPNA